MQNLGVLVSGQGSNLRNLVERGYPVVAVATNRPECPAARWAASVRLQIKSFPKSEHASTAVRDQAMREWLLLQGVQIVVLAGYDRVLSSEFVNAFKGRLVNIHPSLLPAFAGGMNAVEQALRRGVKISGCTVH
ncbi:MAG: phosphoribosylglycinamide formyltransferase, partial [Candidatus Dormibacteraceae bacterium]